MGQLSKTTVYMSGAIDRCPNLGIDWRLRIAAFLREKYSCKVYNPMDKPIRIAGEHEKRDLRKQWKAAGEYDKLADFVREIRHVDLRLCDLADWGIFYLDLEIYATGTFEELFLMNRQKKPLLVVCKQGKAHVPDWLFGVIDHRFFFDSFEDMLPYLDQIDAGWDDGSGRWLIMDY